MVIFKNHESRKNFQKWSRLMNLVKMTLNGRVHPIHGHLDVWIFEHFGKVSTHSDIVACEMTKMPLLHKLIFRGRICQFWPKPNPKGVTFSQNRGYMLDIKLRSQTPQDSSLLQHTTQCHYTTTLFYCYSALMLNVKHSITHIYSTQQY